MNVIVNGEPREISANLSVAQLLDELGVQPQATVVQRNEEIVDRDRFADTLLATGDRIELVRFVGGG